MPSPPAPPTVHRICGPRAIGSILLALTLVSCTEQPSSLAPNASEQIVESLRQDLALPRHSSDGGGSAALESGPSSLEIGEPGTWTFLYTAGPEGIQDGGWLFFQVSPFWNWSTPNVVNPMTPGYTVVSTEAEDLVLEADTLDRQLLGIRITGRPLLAGEEIRVTYGAEGGARTDSFAEDESPFFFAVDGDGDGIRGLVPEPVTVDITAAEPARVILTLPSVARAGELIDLRAGLTDSSANAATSAGSAIALDWYRRDEPEAPIPDSLPRSITLAAGETGAVIDFAAPSAGTFVVEATSSAGSVGWSNPLVISDELEKVLWGDVHGHSNLSDGTGTPEQYFRYARDVAGLDFSALTDHDHWGMQPLATHPELWDRIRDQVASFHQPGRFVTLPAFEWTSWLHGHRHVLYFGDRSPLFSSVDPDYETPTQLWDAVRPFDALTFAHHSAGEPIATNWDYPPDPELEPVTEIVSIHGSSEAADSPGTVRGTIPGNFVRDVLARGYRLGFIGSGDGHDGHPGLSHLANPNGGLAAVLTEDRTRAGIRKALKARRCYATNGRRILLDVRLDGALMGSEIAPASAPLLEVEVIATAPIVRLDIIRAGAQVVSMDLDEPLSLSIEHVLTETRTGDALYVRIIQRDGGVAWSSPFFVGSPNR